MFAYKREPVRWRTLWFNRSCYLCVISLNCLHSVCLNYQRRNKEQMLNEDSVFFVLFCFFLCNLFLKRTFVSLPEELPPVVIKNNAMLALFSFFRIRCHICILKTDGWEHMHLWLQRKPTANLTLRSSTLRVLDKRYFLKILLSIYSLRGSGKLTPSQVLIIRTLCFYTQTILFSLLI